MGDIDHRLMCAPFIRLAEYKKTPLGDVVGLYDFRIRQPNKTKLEPIVLHSLEHIIIEGFRHFLGDKFVNAAPMGCQTGIYIILLDILDVSEVKNILVKVMMRALGLEQVPYRNLKQCGQESFHDISLVRPIIMELLENESSLLEVF